jgi:allophanate hydrolase subunit 1
VSTVSSAVIARQDAQADGKPSVTYRYAGDRGVLIEYGEMVFDLALNFFVLAAGDALAAAPPDGLIETAPGLRSMLVSYDPETISTGHLVDHLQALHDELRPERGITISSRLVYMPVAFDDSQSRAAVARYIHSIRKDAPNAEGGTNIDYVVRYNGLRDRDELYETVLGTEQWTAFIGFFPGLPFMFPLDPRDAIFVPKYNPTRTWTAEGALGIGGPCYAIYPVESAGGYQLIGRTLPIYDVRARNEVFRENPLLLRAGDRIKFERVDEDELMAQFEGVHADTYRYRIEDSPFDVGAYLEFAASVSEVAAERNRRREEAAAATPVP